MLKASIFDDIWYQKSMIFNAEIDSEYKTAIFTIIWKTNNTKSTILDIQDAWGHTKNYKKQVLEYMMF